MEKACLLVHSGDRGQWIWPHWWKYYKANWNCADFIDTVFLGESNFFVPPDDGPPVISKITGKVPWGRGLLDALSQLPYEYIIYHHEDYFIDGIPERETLRALLYLMPKHNIRLVKMSGMWAGDLDWDKKTRQRSNIILFDQSLSFYPREHDYLISHQSAIWERNFLSSTIQPHYSPWCHELEGTTALRKRGVHIHVFEGAPPIPYSETVQGNTVRKGAEKWFPENDPVVKEHMP